MRRTTAQFLFLTLGAISVVSTVAHALELKTPNVPAPHVSPPHVTTYQGWKQSVKNYASGTSQSARGVILRDEQGSGQPGWQFVGKPHHPKHD